jgi:hypothetical protein
LRLANRREATNIGFKVLGLNANESAAVSFDDVDNHQVTVNVSANRRYPASLSNLDEGIINSSRPSNPIFLPFAHLDLG